MRPDVLMIGSYSRVPLTKSFFFHDRSRARLRRSQENPFLGRGGGFRSTIKPEWCDWTGACLLPLQLFPCLVYRHGDEETGKEGCRSQSEVNFSRWSVGLYSPRVSAPDESGVGFSTECCRTISKFLGSQKGLRENATVHVTTFEQQIQAPYDQNMLIWMHVKKLGCSVLMCPQNISSRCMMWGVPR